MKQIQTDKAPGETGLYSQAIIAGGFLFASGQGGLDPATGTAVPGSFQTQANQAMQNLQAILEAAGSSLLQVVKTTCYLRDMKDLAKFNTIYEMYFPTKPARTCVAVKKLPSGLLCEIDAVAYLSLVNPGKTVKLTD